MKPGRLALAPSGPTDPPDLERATAAVRAAEGALATAREKLLAKRAAEAVALTALDADESTQPAYRRSVDLRESAERIVSRKADELATARAALDAAEREQTADELAAAELRAAEWQAAARPVLEQLLLADRTVSELADRLADLVAANQSATAECAALAAKIGARTAARPITLPALSHVVQTFLSAQRRAEDRPPTQLLHDLPVPAWTETGARSAHESACATLAALGLP
ncbi:MAG: hypothetical protein ACLQVI_00625 [Polyangiaceae bacterium]